MLKYLKKGIAVWMIGWICAVLLAGIAFLCFALGNEGAVTETWDLADYGRVYGVQFEHTKAVQEDFNSIFPREITPSFEDVHYHYAASDVGIGYEFNLEFTIPDEEQFRAYAASVAPQEAFTIFPYDEDYLEYLPCENFLSIIAEDDFTQEDLTFDWIEQACIKRVLINPAEQRFVIVLMQVRPVICSSKLRLDYFLDRFNIDPKQFAADYGDGWE